MGKKKVELHERECATCGKVFMPKLSINVCCSEECQRERALKISREYNRKKVKNTLHIFKCAVCGNAFETVKPNRKTCSADCKKIYEKREAKERQKRHYEKKKQETKKRKKVKSLAEFNAEARAMGMTYGEYSEYLRKRGEI